MQAGTCRYAKKNVGATQVGYVKIPKGNEKLLKEAVATVGPVSIGLFGRSPFLHLYANGKLYALHMLFCEIFFLVCTS